MTGPTFPLHGSMSIAQADKLIAYIRRIGTYRAVVGAPDRGMTVPKMRAFIERHRDMIDVPDLVA